MASQVSKERSIGERTSTALVLASPTTLPHVAHTSRDVASSVPGATMRRSPLRRRDAEELLREGSVLKVR